ncbi:TlpA family protein disulfide reductase [Chitinophaga sp. Hz27]|uniref:TlpA family protein disulfide reductase n=1 Tax=Chitinophaga sp. Hz27 TaxID=3347169 RepID=UPI0035DC7EEC
MKKNWFNRSNIINGIFLLFLILMLVSPSAKSYVMRGLMAVGLFQPSVHDEGAGNEIPPDTRFQDESGNMVSIASLKGKVVFLNFWATWCPPCRAEMPALNQLYQELKNDPDIVFLIVDADSNLAKASKFQQENGYTLPLYAAASAIAPKVYSGTLPTTVIIDKKGNIRERYTGAKDYSNKGFKEFLHKLAAE